VEWADRLGEETDVASGIHLRFSEERDGRQLEVYCTDIPLPETETVTAWREEVLLPANVTAHCEAVAALSIRLADVLLEQGQFVRRGALQSAALVHDLLRFLDFKPGGGPASLTAPSPAQIRRWNELQREFAGFSHEEAAARFLADQGFAGLGRIVATHGVRIPLPKDATTEQQLLYYADKRVAGEDIVSIQERFRDFNERYAGGNQTAESRRWQKDALEIEQKLFPGGVPF
jgi:hypothetical protein